MSKFIQNNGKSSQSFQAEKIIINSEGYNKKQSFLENIKSHPVILYCSVAILAFSMGFGARVGIENSSNQVLVTQNSYVLLKDLEKEYISIDSYNELKEKIEIYENSLFEKDTKINELQKQLDEQQEWQKRYDALVNERNEFEIQLNNMINFSTGLIGYSEEKNEPKREELLRKIKVRDEQINLILEKINSKK